MDSLRLTLLVIGLAFIAILYLVLRIKSGRGLQWPDFLRFSSLRLLIRRRQPRNEDVYYDAGSGETDYNDLDEDDLAALSQLSQHTRRQNDEIDTSGLGEVNAVDAEEEEGESLVIVLNVMAKADNPFHGADILAVLRANDLEHGEMMIFHRYPDGAGHSRPVFSMANTVEPGTFDLSTIEHLHTPGLSLFMQLPGPIDSREAFELMLKTGRQVAEQLGGDLCDERRNVLTLQTIGHLKEQIEAFLFRRKMAGLQKQRATGKGRGTSH